MRSLSVAVTLCFVPALVVSAPALNLSDPVLTALEFDTPRACVVADFNGDARLDATVVGGSLVAQFSCYRGEGSGAFGPILGSGTLYKTPIDAVAGDFNADGELDIAALNGACG